MTSGEKAEPERSAISSTDCRHCLTHPLPGPHTDGKCCLCGVTREGLDEPKKCGYGEHDFKPFQGYRDEPGEPHCLTCGHTQGECAQHPAEKPDLMCTCGCPKSSHMGKPTGCQKHAFHAFRCDHTRCGWKPREEPESSMECEGGCRVYTEPPCTPGGACICGGEWWKHGCKHSLPPEPRCTCGPDEACGDPCDLGEEPGAPDVVHKHVHAYQTGGVFKCSCGSVRLLTDPGTEPPLTPEEEEEASKDEYPACSNCGNWHAPDDGCVWSDPAPPQPNRRPPYLLAYSVQGHLYEIALPGDATVAALDGRLVITHQLGPVAGICQIAPITSEES